MGVLVARYLQLHGFDFFDKDNTLKYLRLGNEYHINSGIKSDLQLINNNASMCLRLQEYITMYGNYPNLHQAKTIDSVVYLKSDFS